MAFVVLQERFGDTDGDGEHGYEGEQTRVGEAGSVDGAAIARKTFPDHQPEMGKPLQARERFAVHRPQGLLIKKVPDRDENPAKLDQPFFHHDFTKR